MGYFSTKDFQYLTITESKGAEDTTHIVSRMLRLCLTCLSAELPYSRCHTVGMGKEWVIRLDKSVECRGVTQGVQLVHILWYILEFLAAVFKKP